MAEVPGDVVVPPNEAPPLVVAILDVEDVLALVKEPLAVMLALGVPPAEDPVDAEGPEVAVVAVPVGPADPLPEVPVVWVELPVSPGEVPELDPVDNEAADAIAAEIDPEVDVGLADDSRDAELGGRKHPPTKVRGRRHMIGRQSTVPSSYRTTVEATRGASL
jgi:hypothetical protein